MTFLNARVTSVYAAYNEAIRAARVKRDTEFAHAHDGNIITLYVNEREVHTVTPRSVNLNYIIDAATAYADDVAAATRAYNTALAALD